MPSRGSRQAAHLEVAQQADCWSCSGCIVQQSSNLGPQLRLAAGHVRPGQPERLCELQRQARRGIGGQHTLQQAGSTPASGRARLRRRNAVQAARRQIQQQVHRRRR